MIHQVTEKSQVPVDHVSDQADGPFENSWFANHKVVIVEDLLEDEVRCHLSDARQLVIGAVPVLRELALEQLDDLYLEQVHKSLQIEHVLQVLLLLLVHREVVHHLFIIVIRDDCVLEVRVLSYESLSVIFDASNRTLAGLVNAPEVLLEVLEAF